MFLKCRAFNVFLSICVHVCLCYILMYVCVCMYNGNFRINVRWWCVRLPFHKRNKRLSRASVYRDHIFTRRLLKNYCGCPRIPSQSPYESLMLAEIEGNRITFLLHDFQLFLSTQINFNTWHEESILYNTMSQMI